MMLAIGQESIEQTSCILPLSGSGIHEGLFVAGRDETALHQTTRHRRQSEYGQIILLGSQILPSRSLAHIPLHVLSQFHTVLHILVLNELKHDITLWRVRVVALIGLLIVFLQQNHGILPLCHFQVLQHTCLLTCTFTRPQGIGLESTGHLPFGQRIDMYRDKEVGLVFVGNLGTPVELYERISLTGIDDFHVGTVLFDHPPESQSIFQRQVFLLHLTLSDGTSITATMPRIDDQCEIGLGCPTDRRLDGHKAKERNTLYPILHLIYNIYVVHFIITFSILSPFPMHFDPGTITVGPHRRILFQ